MTVDNGQLSQGRGFPASQGTGSFIAGVRSMCPQARHTKLSRSARPAPVQPAPLPSANFLTVCFCILLYIHSIIRIPRGPPLAGRTVLSLSVRPRLTFTVFGQIVNCPLSIVHCQLSIDTFHVKHFCLRFPEKSGEQLATPFPG